MSIKLRDVDGYPVPGEIQMIRARRAWSDTSNEQFLEILGDYAPDRTGAWYLVYMGKIAESIDGVVTHPRSAIPLTPPEALAWMEGRDIRPPDDVTRDARLYKKDRGQLRHRHWQERPSLMAVTKELSRLSPRLQEHWDLLRRRCLTPHEIAQAIYHDSCRVENVRTAISRINKIDGYEIVKERSGYMRPDAPPEDQAALAA